jgi:catechol 2,3-dioxygenase-like lactoylglutathione lyase family enzyme
VGQATRIAFQVASGSLAYWKARLDHKGIASTNSTTRFKRTYLEFRDSDGIALEIVETENPRQVKPWTASDVPPEHALHGFSGVTLALGKLEPTADLLTGVMGARFDGEDGDYTRYALGEGLQVTNIDLIEWPIRSSGGGSGIIHHVAWGTASDEEQAAWHHKLTSCGLHVSPVMDRNYFHSIYYREPGHVLFEIATTLPGFAVDEPVESLGKKLMLPLWLESQRSSLEASLIPLNPPQRES